MTAVQMNVRIDSVIKSEGDAVFAEAGYSPSEAARLVWGFAARNRRRPKVVRAMIDSLRDPRDVAAEERTRQKKRAEIDEWIERGQDIIEAFFEETGVERPAYEPLTQKEQDDLLADYLVQDAERTHLGLSWDEYDAKLDNWKTDGEANIQKTTGMHVVAKADDEG